MATRISEHLERLRDGARGLGCSRSEALALAVLLAGAGAALVLLWWSGRPATQPVAVLEAAEPIEPAAADSGASLRADPQHGTTSSAGSPEGAAGAAATGGARTVVHVSGLVAHPGVYDLAEGARVADAIHAAGGALPDAALASMNLARVVTDGEQVHVPAEGESQGEQPAAAGSSGPAPNNAWLPDGRLDVNRATAADLEELPGIGPILAERIIEHREELGGFDSIGDLLGVRGIGEKTLAALADLIAP